MRRALALVLALGIVACRVPRPDAPGGRCSHVRTVRLAGVLELCEDAWSCSRPPGGSFDSVGLRRLARCTGAGGPVVLYLPGMHMQGGTGATDPRRDLGVFLAVAGVRSWSFDWRTHAVPALASAADLEVLRAWTADVFTDDAAWGLRFVRAREQAPIVLAGFSHGAAFAYRLAARGDEPLAGLLVLDGAVAREALAAEGPPAIDVGGQRLPWALRQRLLDTVVADPRGPSPVPGFRTAGEALVEILYTAPTFGGRGGLANTRAAVSDIGDLAALLRTYDRWWPRATLGAAPTGPPRRPLRVLAFASETMGPAWIERVRTSATTFGGADAQVQELTGYGHLDVLVGRRAAEDVFAPALTWLTHPTR